MSMSPARHATLSRNTSQPSFINAKKHRSVNSSSLILRRSIQGSAMDYCYNGLGRIFDSCKRLPQARRQRWLTEFRDISSCHERTTFARKDADFDFWVRRKIGDPLDHRCTYADADGVYRWIVDPDDADVAALFESTLHYCLQRNDEFLVPNLTSRKCRRRV